MIKDLKAYKEKIESNICIAEMMHIAEKAKDRKKRTYYSKTEKAFLIDYYSRNSKPSSNELQKIGKELDRTSQEIAIWFNNHQQSLRNKKRKKPNESQDS